MFFFSVSINAQQYLCIGIACKALSTKKCNRIERNNNTPIKVKLKHTASDEITFVACMQAKSSAPSSSDWLAGLSSRGRK
jgi:hypothetical protein